MFPLTFRGVVEGLPGQPFNTVDGSSVAFAGQPMVPADELASTPSVGFYSTSVWRNEGRGEPGA